MYVEETIRQRPAGLTNRQREFARILSRVVFNAECARKAGYAEGQAKKTQPVSEWPRLSTSSNWSKNCAKKERRYGVTLGQLKRLDELSRGAEESGQFSAAINAEKIGRACGLNSSTARTELHNLTNCPRGDRRAYGDSEKPHCGLIEGKVTEHAPAEQISLEVVQQYPPKKSHWNRIENRAGTGTPDVYLVIDGVPCWFDPS